MNQLTNEEVKNIIVLINKVTISGQESVTVALLLAKLQTLLTPGEAEKK